MHQEYVHHHTVTFAETNLVGNVYYAHYAAWQGACREHFLLDHAPGVVEQLAAGDLALVTVRLEVDYIDECFAGDRVQIRMRQTSAAARSAVNRVRMGFTYLRSGVTVAVGEQTVACMQKGLAGYKPCAIPDELLGALAQFGTAGPAENPSSRGSWTAAVEW